MLPENFSLNRLSWPMGLDYLSAPEVTEQLPKLVDNTGSIRLGPDGTLFLGMSRTVGRQQYRPGFITDPLRIEPEDLESLFPQRTLSPFEPLIMEPGDFVLGITEAMVTLPSNLAGMCGDWIAVKQPDTGLLKDVPGLYAVLAPMIQPGSRPHRIVLELSNRTGRVIRLDPMNSYVSIRMMPIKGNGERNYSGSYVGQDRIKLPDMRAEKWWD